MTEFYVPTGVAAEEVRDRFISEQAATELQENAAAMDNAAYVGAHDLFSYATGIIPFPNTRVEQALEQFSPVRVAFRKMLTQTAVADLGVAVAASDGDLPTRSGDNCRIRFERSKAERDRIYVIIELGPALDEEKRLKISHLVVFDDAEVCHQFPLPPARQNLIQFLTEEGSDVLELLAAPSSQVLLR